MSEPTQDRAGATDEGGEQGPKVDPETGLPGPFEVGAYAARIRAWMSERPEVCLIGEVVDHRAPGQNAASVHFTLCDPRGAVPCAMWRDRFEAADLGEKGLENGDRVIVGGRLEYYTGKSPRALREQPDRMASSPRLTFRCTWIRRAGEGDLLRQLAALREAFLKQGLDRRQARLARPLLPRSIGVVTAQSGEARRDLVAALERRGWGGRLVWAFAPVQDRNAAPAIRDAVQDLAAAGVEVIVVTRGGGSLMDLWAFCDETLCRTIALLGTPVVAAVGHHRDSTLIDDVAAVACSTPTHAAEAAVPLNCLEARAELGRACQRLAAAAGRSRNERLELAGLTRRASAAARRSLRRSARELVHLDRAPRRHLTALRTSLHQRLREVRAAAQRGLGERRDAARAAAEDIGWAVARARRGIAGARSATRTLTGVAATRAPAAVKHRRRALEGAASALRAHDPARTLERGYVRAQTPDGELVTSARAALSARRLRLTFADAAVDARIEAPAEGASEERGSNER